MDGAPAPSPSSNGSDFNPIIIIFSFFLFFLVSGLAVWNAIREDLERQRQRHRTPDIEAGNPSRRPQPPPHRQPQQQQQQQPRPWVDTKRPPPPPSRPRVAQRLGHDHAKEFSAECTHEQCVICLDEVARRTLPCGHEFHRDCINHWLERGPICRRRRVS